MAELNVHPVSDSAARVSRFLLGRTRYAGRERIMAVDGYPLNASDLKAMVDFIHSCNREVAVQNNIGAVSPLLYNDPAWMASNEKLVERHATEWKEVSVDESRR